MTFHDLLTSTPAAFIDLTGSEVKVELVITNELLFVMNCEEDAQQQAFSLAELEVSLKPENPHLLTLQWKDRSHQPTGEVNMFVLKSQVCCNSEITIFISSPGRKCSFEVPQITNN